MAIINYTGFESGTLTVATELNIASGTGMGVSNTTVRTGTYALRCNATGANAGYQPVETYAAAATITTFSAINTYATFYFRYATAPASGSEYMYATFSTVAALKFGIRLNSAGNLEIYDSTATIIGSAGATTLSANTWYRIDVYTGTGASASYQVQIDGVEEFVGTTANLTAFNSGSIRLGKYVNVNSQTVDFFYDDVVVSDSSYIVGNPEVRVSKPTANGTTMVWTGGTGGSDYQEVDEIPPSDTDAVTSLTSGAPQDAQFAMQDTGTIGVSGTIKAVKICTRTRENTTATSSCNRVVIWSGASNTATTATNTNTTYTAGGLLRETDPDTSSAWTSSGVDAVQAGARENNNVAQRLGTVLMHVLSVPAGNAPATVKVMPTLLFMGVG